MTSGPGAVSGPWTKQTKHQRGRVEARFSTIRGKRCSPLRNWTAANPVHASRDQGDRHPVGRRGQLAKDRNAHEPSSRVSGQGTPPRLGTEYADHAPVQE